MSKSAKELCSMLITRKLQELDEEEEDVVVNFLEDLGIEVELDTDNKTLCKLLLEKTMLEEIGKMVPLSAYANQILEKEVKVSEQKEKEKKLRQIKRKRENTKIKLEQQHNNLPGCVSDDNIISTKGLYDFVIDDQLGIKKLSDGDVIYTLVVSVSPELYKNIFLNVTNPILELTSAAGNRVYVRLTEPQNIADKYILINPLVAKMLGLGDNKAGFVKVCINMPQITKIGFTYYGTQSELDENLPYLINRLPDIINSFSSLRLGLELDLSKNGKNIIVRVDKLEGENGIPIFAGILPLGVTDIPFDIDPDEI